MNADLSPADPSDLEPDSEPTSDDMELDYEDVPCTDGDYEFPSDDIESEDITKDDESRWEAFIPDDDEIDPEPDPGDFWIESSQDHAIESLGDKKNLLVG